MKKLLSAILLFALLATPALAQRVVGSGTQPTDQGVVNAINNTAVTPPPTAPNTPTAGTGIWDVQPTALYNSTYTLLTTGQYSNLRTDGYSNLRVNMTGSVFSGFDGYNNSNIVGITQNTTDSSYRILGIAPWAFNGSSWDRDFECSNSAVVNVTAANTTQVVALSGSTVIRVCSIAISMSAAGTAGVYTGTGTNCGTGTTALIQDMTLATGTPLALSAAKGSIVRSSSGGEICVKAVTGNVTGVITYAQF